MESILTLKSLRTSLIVKLEDPELTTFVKSPLILIFPALFSMPKASIFRGSKDGRPISGMPEIRYGFNPLNEFLKHELI